MDNERVLSSSVQKRLCDKDSIQAKQLQKKGGLCLFPHRPTLHL